MATSDVIDIRKKYNSAGGLRTPIAPKPKFTPPIGTPVAPSPAQAMAPAAPAVAIAEPTPSMGQRILSGISSLNDTAKAITNPVPTFQKYGSALINKGIVGAGGQAASDLASVGKVAADAGKLALFGTEGLDQSQAAIAPASSTPVQSVSKPIDKTVSQPASASVSPTQNTVQNSGVFVRDADGKLKPLQRQLGGGVITNQSRVNELGMQFQNVGDGEATNAIASYPNSDKLRSIDANSAIAVPSGGINRVGSTTSGGGIVVSNSIDRPSGVIGTLPPRELIKGGMTGPTFNLRPSKVERAATIAGDQAIKLAGVQGATAENVARSGAEAAKSQAMATEAEKTRRSGETLEGKRIEAKGRVDAAMASKKADTANKFNAIPPETKAKAYAEYVALRDNPVVNKWLDGRNQESEDLYKADLAKAKALLDQYGIDENGQEIAKDSQPAPAAAIPEGATGKTKDGKPTKRINGQWVLQ